MASYFPALYGNADTKERLGRAIAGGRLPHALILSGPRGSGRRTLAREIAAALVCEGRGDPLPCGTCENCRRVREGIFPDLHIVAPDEGKSLIPVAKIREMRAEMSLSAVESAAAHRRYAPSCLAASGFRPFFRAMTATAPCAITTPPAPRPCLRRHTVRLGRRSPCLRGAG